MSSGTETVTEVTIKNGVTIRLNDHVYSAPPWQKRDPVPYSIGRVIEFLPREPEPTDFTKPLPYRGNRVRLAWFYRPADLDKGTGDHRVLLAALFSEIVPITNIRGKCTVRHRDKIADLAAYTRKEDCFYFYQLFDPFTKENYEVIMASEVHNCLHSEFLRKPLLVPGHIKDVIVSRYEFLVCEREALPDLQDTLRLCETCGDWCPGPESVMCELCRKHFHMECVNPPLLSKPSRGYGWSCANCNNRREIKDTETAVSKPRPAKELLARARARARANGRSEDEADRYWKGWSFRYFGLHTVAEDTLDPDDMIYVRAPTRIGRPFQVTVAPFPEGPVADGELRGEDDTIEYMSTVCHMTPQQMEEVDRRKTILTARSDLQRNVDWIEEVIRRFSEAWRKGLSFYSVNMRNPLCTRAWKAEGRYRDRDWSEGEEIIFEDSVRRHHSELRLVRSDLKSRTISEVVRHFGHWKNDQLKMRNSMVQRPTVEPNYYDDNISVYEGNDRRVYVCAVCRTRESESWWKAPRNLYTNSMCDECGVAWRKYAIRSVKGTEREKELAARMAQYGTPERTEAPVTRSSKSMLPSQIQKREALSRREGTPQAAPPSKRQKGNGGVATPQKYTCSLCRKMGPVGQVIRCQKCGFTIHAGCIGVPLEDVAAEWVCEICSNEQTMESNLDTACALCPANPAERKKGAKDSAFFRAAKPTENRGWVHVLCATFNQQLEYTDAKRMRLVEGISSIAKKNYQHKCICCGSNGGCLSQCDLCLTAFHPVCAWNHGFRFGIELITAKSHQRKDYPIVEFRGETGHMNAVIICDNHNSNSRRIFDLCDIDEKGRTALQVFTTTYKQANQNEKTYGLLRKARRLDEIVKAPRFDAVPLIDPRSELPIHNCCIFCSTEYSPYWWPTDSFDSLPIVQEDVKMVNGDHKVSLVVSGHPNGSSTGDVAMVGDTDEEMEAPVVVAQRICHTCYFTRMQERNQPITLDLSTAILVI